MPKTIFVKHKQGREAAGNYQVLLSETLYSPSVFRENQPLDRQLWPDKLVPLILEAIAERDYAFEKFRLLNVALDEHKGYIVTIRARDKDGVARRYQLVIPAQEVQDNKNTDYQLFSHPNGQVVITEEAFKRAMSGGRVRHNKQQQTAPSSQRVQQPTLSPSAKDRIVPIENGLGSPTAKAKFAIVKAALLSIFEKDAQIKQKANEEGGPRLALLKLLDREQPRPTYNTAFFEQSALDIIDALKSEARNVGQQVDFDPLLARMLALDEGLGTTVGFVKQAVASVRETSPVSTLFRSPKQARGTKRKASVADKKTLFSLHKMDRAHGFYYAVKEAMQHIKKTINDRKGYALWNTRHFKSINKILDKLPQNNLQSKVNAIISEGFKKTMFKKHNAKKHDGKRGRNMQQRKQFRVLMALCYRTIADIRKSAESNIHAGKDPDFKNAKGQLNILKQGLKTLNESNQWLRDHDSQNKQHLSLMHEMESMIVKVEKELDYLQQDLGSLSAYTTGRDTVSYVKPTLKAAEVKCLKKVIQEVDKVVEDVQDASLSSSTVAFLKKIAQKIGIPSLVLEHLPLEQDRKTYKIDLAQAKRLQKYLQDHRPDFSAAPHLSKSSIAQLNRALKLDKKARTTLQQKASQRVDSESMDKPRPH